MADTMLMRFPTRLSCFLLLPMLAGFGAGCGDDVGAADGSFGGSNSYNATSSGSSGSTGVTNGSGSATSGTGGVGSGGMPPPIAPPPEPEACEDLDPNSPVVLYLSADDSNSMASPVRAREWLNDSQGIAPDALGIRTYEFFNYYRIDYPAPAQGDVALFAEGAPSARAGEFALQLAVRSANPLSTRRPMTLTLVLDTSGSMGGASIERERAAVLALASRLRPGDIVNAVTWSTDQNVLLTGHAASGPNDAAVVALANGLSADGGTDLHAGLVRGYQLAEQSFDVQRLNRLVLISDGGANVGLTNETLIGEKSQLQDGEGIYLVGIGTGPASGYNDTLMDVVTDAGRGAYVYLDSTTEAQRILADRFDEVMDVAARGVQVELTLPWYFQMQKFHGEQYSENPEEVKPQHLAPGDAMVFSQTLKACDPQLIGAADPVSLRVTWQEPVTHVARERAIATTVGEITSNAGPRLAKGLAIVAYAEALKVGSYEHLQGALETAQAAQGSGADPELAEIVQLLHKALGTSP